MMNQRAETISSSQRVHQDLQSSITFTEKLDKIPASLWILANVFTALLTGPFRSEETRHPSLYYHVVATAFRTATSRFSTRQLQSGAASTDDAYVAICKKRNAQPKTEILMDGTAAHWIGKKGAKRIILYFHGGAYCVPAAPGTFEYIFQMIELLEKERKDVACLFLSYDLAPTRTYPRQLAQAAILLNYTLNTLSYEPSDILLAGDSAGGNLALALLSHIVHPHPDQSVPQVKLPGPEKLHSVALLSPWVDFSTSTAGSFYVNRYQDLFGPGTLKRWSDAFLYGDIKEVRKDGKEDSYNEPIGADADWWEGVKDVVDSVCIVAGGRELFLDSIVEFAETLKKTFPSGKVDFFVAPGDFHVQANVDTGLGVSLGDPNETEMSKYYRGWVKSKL